jgi:hypothetical protein
MRGMYNMPCWNGLSQVQQHRLLTWGNLPIGFAAEGWCPNGAEVGIETSEDESPGPRFYCRGCAIDFLKTPYVTKTGKILSDADIEELADEAEAGYDVSNVKDRR